ncbi:hypothetical protein [Aliikangiella sp. G2MR2-5]|uniref:hypothetical protein n=1 Tax=Aliikangiella sp. G2MR2-5 TaxID=2788943 RepID=UPI0018ABDD77|nr:hypothetical protein [Aliikangiella sp. G2MR2-5]
MKKIILFCVLAVYLSISSGFAEECPDLQEVARFITQDNLPEVKKLSQCNFDFHLENDKALHIAAKNGSLAVEKFLLSKGLEYKTGYLQTLWMFAINNGRMLENAINMASMTAKDKPDENNWQEIIKSHVYNNSHMIDGFGKPLIFGRSKERGFYFCSLGRDNKVGGQYYEQDVCSDSNLEELIKLNFPSN